MQACGFCEKYNEKRDQPLKPFRALIEFDFDAKLILDNDPAGYGMNPYYAGAGPVVPYRERAYYHHRYPRYAGPVGPYRPYPRYPHRPLGVRY